MGQLARYLQDQFIARMPRDWSCGVEARVLDERFERLLGYAPQADVLLASDDGRFRLWIEFEVSRADPVANHAKFATAHLFQPQKPTDTFVSMCRGGWTFLSDLRLSGARRAGMPILHLVARTYERRFEEAASTSPSCSLSGTLSACFRTFPVSTTQVLDFESQPAIMARPTQMLALLFGGMNASSHESGTLQPAHSGPRRDFVEG